MEARDETVGAVAPIYLALDKQLLALTGQELIDLLQYALKDIAPALQAPQPREYVRGLEGIMKLFSCSRMTAHRLKSTTIKEAVFQNGGVIMTDVQLALELFQKQPSYRRGKA